VIEEIKARANAATPGPWEYEYYWYYDSPQVETLREVVCRVQDEDDGRFIAHARQDIPDLISEITRLTAENEGLRANSFIQEAIIKRNGNPLNEEKIVKLMMENSSIKSALAQSEARAEKAEKRSEAATGDLRMVCECGEVCASCHWCCDRGPDFPCAKHAQWCGGINWEWRGEGEA